MILLTYPLLAVGCGRTGHPVVFRPIGEEAVLKLKLAVGQQFFDGLTGPGVVEVCSWRGCKRAGEAIICSTLNVRDPVVCEIRLDAGGLLGPREDLSLYHSAEDNRHYGDAERAGEALTIDGAALSAMAAFTGAEADDLWLQVVDPATGRIVLRAE